MIDDDRMMYKDLRAVNGWESKQSASDGLPFAIGKTMRVELGYAFSRELEFENETRVEDLDDGFALGISTKFLSKTLRRAKQYLSLLSTAT